MKKQFLEQRYYVFHSAWENFPKKWGLPVSANSYAEIAVLQPSKPTKALKELRDQ